MASNLRARVAPRTRWATVWLAAVCLWAGAAGGVLAQTAAGAAVTTLPRVGSLPTPTSHTPASSADNKQPPASESAEFQGPPLPPASWPKKPVTLMVNAPPGDAADVLARAVAPVLAKHWGQRVTVRNRAAGAGSQGVAEVMRAAKDGYTLLLGPSRAISLNPLMQRKPQLEPLGGVTPIAAVARTHLYLLVHPSVPVANASQLVYYLQANPGALRYASTGPSTFAYMASVKFVRMAQLQLEQRVFNSSAQALSAVLQGNPQFLFDTGAGLPLVQEGQLKLLAVGGRRRLERFAHVPTLYESGFAGFDTDTVFGVYAPTQVPDDVVRYVREGIAVALEDEAVLQTLEVLGATPTHSAQADFDAHHRRERARFEGVIKELGLQLQE